MSKIKFAAVFLTGIAMTGVASAQQYNPAPSTNLNILNPSSMMSGGTAASGTGTTITTPSMSINPLTLPDATVGLSYSQSLTVATSQQGPFTWSIASGIIPNGLVLKVMSNATSTGGSNQNSGGNSTAGNVASISGTPATPGAYTFTVSVMNGNNSSMTQTYGMNVNANMAIATNTASLIVPAPTPQIPTIVSSTAQTQTSSGGTSASESVRQLESERNVLISEIQLLQSQLLKTSTTTQQAPANPLQALAPATFAGVFTRNLFWGSKGPDVVALQQFLNANGAQIAASGPGSPGNETYHFGNLTKAALANWQSANGISPAQGYFGPETRNRVNAEMSTGGSSSGTTGAGTNASGT